jgi:hypothetical protein
MAIEEINIKDKIESFDRREMMDAKELNEKVSFYSELQTKKEVHPYFYKFRKKLQELYRDTNKVDIFLNAYTGDNLSTNTITETIFDRLFNVFDSQNKNIQIDISNNESKADLIKFITPFLEYFKKEGWQHLKTMFNSFITVDVNAENETYIYNIAPQYVCYLELTEDKENVKEIIYSFDNENYFYNTQEFYAKYIKQNNVYIQDYLKEHDYKECPTNFFLNDKLNASDLYLRKNIIVPQTDNLHKYIVKDGELYMSELLTSSPKMALPSDGCGYNVANEVCKGGQLYTKGIDDNFDNPVLLDDYTIKLCPTCGASRTIGVGGTFYIDFKALANEDNNITVSDLVQYFAPPLEGTEYQKETLQSLETEIIRTSIGETKTISQEARNETDVQSDYENATKILTAFGEMYANTMEFVCRIRLKHKYGKQFNYISIFLGNKFYLLSKQELIEQKDRSTNPIDRTELELKIIQLDYKHDPNKYKAVKNAYSVLPYSGVTDAYFLDLVRLNLVSREDIELRTNFNKYVQLFIEKNKNDFSTLDANYIRKELYKLIDLQDVTRSEQAPAE